MVIISEIFVEFNTIKKPKNTKTNLKLGISQGKVFLLLVACYMQASPTVCIANLSLKDLEKTNLILEISETLAENITIKNEKKIQTNPGKWYVKEIFLKINVEF